MTAYPGPGATTAELATGRRWLDAPARWLDGLTAAFSTVGTLGILGLMLLILGDVIGRGLRMPLTGVPEIVSLSILSIVFLQLANTAAQGKLTRSDMLLGWLARRAPRAGLAADALMHLAGALLVGVLIWAFLPLFLRAWTRGDTVGTVGQFLAPLWPAYGIVLAGSVMLFAVFAMRALVLGVLAMQGGRP